MADQRIWQVLNEQIEAGLAKIIKVDGIDYVQFADEEQPIPPR